jgi:hypothetical protein
MAPGAFGLMQFGYRIVLGILVNLMDSKPLTPCCLQGHHSRAAAEATIDGVAATPGRLSHRPKNRFASGIFGIWDKPPHVS